ncbi:hypothetical protein [Achromobacter spanius]|uniref:hypothetical protein n=1 Tax=Achromobacter spanius TaxID=217203 RepID=UPI00382CB564
MFAAVIFAGVLLIAVIEGKSFALLLAGRPLIGPVVSWYVDLVGPMGDGIVANLPYGTMTIQLLALIGAPLLYGPALLRKLSRFGRQ